MSLALLAKESSLIRLIKKPSGYCIGRGKGTGISLLIGAGKVVTFIGDQGASGSSLYVRIILIKVND